MSPEVLKRAMEPFFTTKAARAGNGPRLAGVDGIVQQAGGDVVIESTPGAGTNVQVLIPVAR